MSKPGTAEVWACLAEVPDPEIPALSVVDLGIVRDVAWTGAGDEQALHVTITPTYSGCPATSAIARDIEHALRRSGVERIALDVRIAPPWTTDWLSTAGREKLLAYGIAPPDRTGLVRCPRCAAADVAVLSWFGSTPCKALYRCNACLEPFDRFKCH